MENQKRQSADTCKSNGHGKATIALHCWEASGSRRGAFICHASNRCKVTALMTEQILAGKIGLVFGVANKRSIAWAIAKAWAAAGARLIFNYQGERLKENVEELVGEFGKQTPLFPCDVSSDGEIRA